MEPMNREVEQAEAAQGGEQTQSVTITKENGKFQIKVVDAAGEESYESDSLEDVMEVLNEEFGGEVEEPEAEEMPAAPVAAPAAKPAKKVNSLGILLGKGM